MTPDLESLLGVLVRNEVAFVVVGGVAVGAHGFARMTLDLDLVPDPERGNLERLVTALSQMGATIPSGARFDPARHAMALRRGQNATLTTDQGGLDIVQRLEGVPPYSRLHEQAVATHVGEVPVLVCSLGHLRAMKSVAGRPQDLADLARLPDID